MVRRIVEKRSDEEGMLSGISITQPGPSINWNRVQNKDSVVSLGFVPN